jgi:hypothetical protein
MKNFKLLIFILLAAFSSSCNKDDGDSTVVGDAIVISKKSGTNTVYAIAYYAYAYSTLKSVSVESALDSTMQVDLAANGIYTTNFLKEPTDKDFTTTKPIADTFIFNAVFESGNTYQTKDAITSDILAPINIEECTYNATKSYAELSWTALTNADSYVITVFNSSGTVVFRSAELANTITGVNLSASTSGWTSGYPVSGDTYTVRILAYKYEDSTNPNAYHIQSTSYSEASIVWSKKI